MTAQQLEAGKRLNDQIREWERVAKHLTEIDATTTSKNDVAKYINDLLVETQNLGTTQIKSELALICIASMNEYSKKQVADLQKRFDEL